MRSARAALAAVLIGLAAAGPGAAAGQERGPWIIFSSNRSGAWRIWRVRPDGSEMRQLTRAAPAEQDVDPVFRPDGKAILFTSTRRGAVGVWTASADGSAPRRICDGDQAEWSPDGRWIVFRRDEKIFVRELASGAERRVSPDDWPHPSGPAWRPDGKSIAAACRWSAGNALFILSVTGGEPRKVYDQKGACEPHWSPDGKRLVYETETHICTILPDGSGNRLVTWFGGVQRYARFSPDGRTIVFCQGASPKGPWQLYSIPAHGGSPRKITDEGSDMTPDWR